QEPEHAVHVIEMQRTLRALDHEFPPDQLDPLTAKEPQFAKAVVFFLGPAPWLHAGSILCRFHEKSLHPISLADDTTTRRGPPCRRPLPPMYRLRPCRCYLNCGFKDGARGRPAYGD